MSGNNTKEISWCEKKLHDSGTKHNVALAAEDALSALPSRAQPQIVLPLFLTSTLSLLASQNTSEEINPRAFIYPFWQTHTEEGAAENAETTTEVLFNRGVRIHVSSHLWRSGYSCLLIGNWAGQSKHSGTTFPIGIIRILDRSDRLQCTQNHNGEETKSWELHFFFLFSSTDHVQSQIQYIFESDCSGVTLLCQESWFRENEWNRNRGSGENKNPKIYIYVYIYIYLYIYEVCIHKKENTHNFKIGSLFF